jgi:hypothetical protein
MQFVGEKEATLMTSAIGICSLVVKQRKTEENLYMYMQFGGEKEAKPMKSAIGIRRYVVKRRQN